MPTSMKQQPFFTPVRMGKLELPNRIVMAPLTRMRAANSGHAPTELHAEYYAQRASAGLIIGECTEISPDAYGWADTPGLWSAEQVRGWRGVTIANPDLPVRFLVGATLNEVHWPTVYASGPKEYTDYPAMQRSSA